MPTEIPAPSFAAAFADHQAGRLDLAEHGYRAVLDVAPDHADALHLLGVIAHQTGAFADAVELIEQAIALRPSDATFFCNLGEAQRRLGRMSDALTCQHQALSLDPELAEAHNNLALALQHDGRLDQAKVSYCAALALRPDYAEALLNLANVLAEQGQLIEATAYFERVLELDPRSTQAHYNLGNALQARGLAAAAIDHYRYALELDPSAVEARNNLGLVLLEQGERAGAIEHFRAALAIAPSHADAHNNLGLALEADGDLPAARAAYEAALRAQPCLPQGHNNLGRVLNRMGDRAAAIASVRHALTLEPGYVEAHNQLGHLLKEDGRLEESIAAFRAAVERDPDDADSSAQLLYQLQHAADWNELDDLGARIDAQTEAALAAGERPGETPFGSLMRSADPARHLAIARSWANGIEQYAAGAGVRFAHGTRRMAKPCLRIGYLSGDFRDHPVGHQIVDLLAAHDRAAFEVFGYAHDRSGPSAGRDRIARHCDRFVDLEPLSDVDAAQRIFDDRVDILVDLGGYTRGNRIQIAALRPAPIQVSYLGFLGTTGSSFIDYAITDRVCVPPREAPQFTERLVHLPACCLVFGEGEARPENRFKRQDCRLPDDGIVFAALGGTAKIEPVMFDLWMALLRQIPGSVLWLYRGSERAVANLRQEASARGVESRRLIFADRVSYEANLERLQLADLGLDTRLYNGGLTTANALWAGVPVVTLRGADFVSRMAASMLTTLELPELITNDLDAYGERARVLAMDPSRRASLKAKLDAALDRQLLFDSARFARHIEAAYAEMWQDFVAGVAPRPIAVEAVAP